MKIKITPEMRIRLAYAESIEIELPSEWQPIETAPKDGRPFWAKGNDFGDANKGQHCCWAYWGKDCFGEPSFVDPNGTQLAHLIEWLPLWETPK